MTAAIDITKEQRKTLLVLLRQFIPGVEVWAYGSRVKWTARPNSDLDLVAFTTPAQSPLVSELKEALAESDLPFLVDFHVWDEVPERFHEIIRKEYVVLQEAKQQEVGLGMSGSGFKECTLGDIAEFRNGKALSPDKYLPFGQHPVFGSNGQIARTNEVLTKEPLVVIGRVGAYCGSVHHVDEPAWVTDNAIIATGKDQTNVRFLYYLLGSLELRRTAIGSAQPLMTQGGLKVVPTIAPPLVKQKAIARILGTLDDKIELNRRMNATLEAMARVLFQSWFVDFDPVRAKLDGRKPASLDAATAALFPAHFQESTLGHIPQGWRVVALHELTSYLSRGIGPAYIDAGGVCVLNQKCVRDHRVDFSKARQHDPLKKTIEGRTLQLFDILVNSTGVGTLGRVAQVMHLSGEAIVDSHLTVVRAANEVDAIFLGIALMLRENDIEELGEGSTGQTELSRTRLGGLLLVTPPPQLQKAFGSAVQPLLKRIAENDLQSCTLATLRDTLLPKMLSGELSVAERIAEETT
ncbi:MAG: restriction endonuclease subunit S [Betaproteobacteria bacterium]|nr:restriction endonuclease subunit S [Betaproteobacteria bacterium]